MLGQFGRRFQAVLARHVDVEEQHLGQQLQRLRHCRGTITHAGQHAQGRPGVRQLGLQRLGQQRLVFGNQGGGRAVAHVFKGNRAVALVPPVLIATN